MSQRSKYEDATRKCQEELLRALQSKNLTKFKMLLSFPQINPNAKYVSHDNGTCMEIACSLPGRGAFVEALLRYVPPSVDEITIQPIHVAAKHGHSDSIEALLTDARTDVGIVTAGGSTALHFVCRYVRPERLQDYAKCIHHLVRTMSPYEINKVDNEGFSAFHVLVRDPHYHSTIEETCASRIHDDNDGLTEETELDNVLNRQSKRIARIRVPSESSDDLIFDIENSDDGLEEQDTFNEEEYRMTRLELAKLMIRLCKADLDIHTSVERRSVCDDMKRFFPEIRELLSVYMPQIDESHMELMRALAEKKIDHLCKLLKQTNEDGTPTLDSNYQFGPPLNTTCLFYACQQGLGAGCIRILLGAKADPNESVEPNMKSAIHILCEKGYFTELDALLSASDVDVNAVDKYGNTALHYIVDEPISKEQQAGRRKCLQILLRRKDLDVNIRNLGNLTAIMLGVQHKQLKELKGIIKSKCNIIDWNMDDGGKPLCQSFRETFPELRKFIPSQVESPAKKISIGTSKMQEEFINKLFFLLSIKNEKEFVSQIKIGRLRIFSVENKTFTFTLLQKAAYYGLSDAVGALLNAGANPNFIFSRNRSPAAVIASQRHHYDVLKIFLENRKNGFDVNATDSKGNTALHYAMRTGSISHNLDIVIQLLRCGASLEITNNVGKLPINDKQLEHLLDQCITTNNKNSLEDGYELIFNYQLIASAKPLGHEEWDKNVNIDLNTRSLQIDKEGEDNLPKIRKILLNNEMDFLYKRSQNEEMSFLLDHPVSLTFLTLKWERIKYVLCLNIFLYLAFLLLLNIFIIQCTNSEPQNMTKFAVTRDSVSGGLTTPLNRPSFPQPDLHERHTLNGSSLWITASFSIFWCILLLREIVQLTVNWKKYFRSFENYLEIFLLIFSCLSFLIPFLTTNHVLQQRIHVISILLSWTELLVFLGQTSFFAKHIQMLKVVLKNYFLPLLCYCSFVIAFGLSFHIMNRGETLNPESKDYDSSFGNWALSIMKTLVMMTGELGFDSFPKDSHFTMILFVVFVLLETIVIINLLAGLASQGTDHIENAAARLELITRVRVIMRIERLLVKLHNVNIRGWKLPLCIRRYLRRVALFAGVPQQERIGIVRPNQSSVLVLGDGSILVLEKSSLDRATQIISRRFQVAKGNGLDNRPMEKQMLEKFQQLMNRLEVFLDSQETRVQMRGMQNTVISDGM